MTTIIFQTKALFDQLAEEVVVTENGVYTYQGPRFAGNLYTPCPHADGRVAMCHDFCEEDIAFFAIQWDEFITAGKVVFVEGGLPADWVYPKEQA